MFSRSGNPFLIFLQSYHENLGQLPVQEYLKGTDDCILWIFTISSLLCFQDQRNPLLTFPLSYHVWVTSEIQVNFRFERYWWFCLINFWNFYNIQFSRSGNPLLIFLQSFHVWVISKIQVDFRFNRYSEVLVIVSCRFLKFLHYLCFWGQGILCWHSYWANMFGGPQKFRSLSGSRGFRGYPNIRSLTKMLIIHKQSRESRRTVTRPTLYCQLTFLTRN